MPREKMVSTTTKPKKRDSSISYIRKSSLVLSIDKNDKIIKFNDKCRQVTGYSYNDVINESFFDVLIPKRYSNQWKGVFNSSRKNKVIEDFKLPLLTHNGHEIMISWSSFPIKSSSDVVGDVDFVGTFIDSWDDSEVSLVRLSKNVAQSKVDVGDSGEAFLRLIKSNEELVKKNQKLEKNIASMKSGRDKKEVSTSYSGKLVYSLADVVGGKKRRQEFERMMKELDTREKKINKLTDKLLKDKKKVNEMRNEFTEWREKLEILESEIYRRNIDLDDRAKLLDSTIDLGKSLGVVNDELTIASNAEKSVNKDNKAEDIINNINFCAVIIQRGILKQVNRSFANLIGYEVEEMVEKSFFDFIAPEGLLDLEKYYLNRLKGDSINSYDIVFLNSDDQTVRMKVKIKSTIFNGKKADVAVFTKPGDIIDDSEIFDFMGSQQEQVDETIEEEALEPETLTEIELSTEDPQIDIEDESEPEFTSEETLTVSEEITEDADEEEQITETEESKTEPESKTQTNKEDLQTETEIMGDDSLEVEAETVVIKKETSEEEAEEETESTKKTDDKQKEEDK